MFESGDKQAPVADFSFHHVGVSVLDLAASVAWYESVLGFEFSRTINIPALAARVTVLKRGTMHVELFEVEGSKAPAEDRSDPHGDLLTHGTKHVGFVVADVPAFAEQLRQRGADVISVNHFKFGCNTFVRDNSGNILEFVQAR